MDNDLQSVQEIRDLLTTAHQAQQEYRSYSQSQVDQICRAMAEAGASQAARLGRLACEETGYGKPEDKELKNLFATQRVWESIAQLKTVGVIHEDRERQVLSIAEPMGIVAALIPSTNPTSTVMFKALISVKARNGIVASPHPKAARCTREAMHVVRDAAERAGAPRGLMACLSLPTAEGTQELMRHRLTSVILATGSHAMVRAAYSAGKPAYGVGSGNVPSFIERTADVPKAVADIISGKQFDYGTLCSTESALVCDAPVKQQVVQACLGLGAYFVTGEEREKLSRLLFDERGMLNPAMVGKSPLFIARSAGIQAPEQVSVLIAELEGVGARYPLSREKLSPVLSFYTADGWREACHRCIELLEFGGVGHTLVIHSNDRDIIMKFAMEKPAFRILVNTQSALGAVGYTNGLDPSLTLGAGTWGGSIVSDNVTARHLLNIKRLAFETRPLHHARTPSSSGKSWMDKVDQQISTPAVEQPRAVQAFGTSLSADEVDQIAGRFMRELR
ncbi:MAG: acetaldehyde dehydrogenase (acetylating) [Bacteroidetes bacterium]|jgi:acetaldehyde dehydrogenase (acetylating)|nr:acetaldehyde dehydrogenase (acetylating) [Bacteroidota bacterium]